MSIISFLFANKLSPLSAFIALPFVAYFIALAILGFSAKAVRLDPSNIYIHNKDGVEVIPLSEIHAVRTFPLFKFTEAFWIKDSLGKWTRTIIQSDSLRKAMAMMPSDALTPYWRYR